MAHSSDDSKKPTTPFSALSEEDKLAIREAQRLRKEAKMQKRKLQPREQEQQPQQQQPQAPRSDRSSPALAPTRCEISQDEYFDACPYRLLRDPNLPPTEDSIALLMRALEAGDQQDLQKFMYFQFSGPESALWNAEFNARLAWEGFFTITAPTGPRRQCEPLPELQPFYGVLLWPNFEASRHMRQALAKLAREQLARERPGYRLSNCADPDRTWQCIEDYHIKRHESNWLTRRYFDMMKAASDNPAINFTMHCIELTRAAPDGDGDGSAKPIAGEIGFSVGAVYTSLSGWTGERTASSVGTVQLALLGRWLQQRGYAFWSLGHCYSPQMDYKRQLGHRIYTRAEFRALLKEHRGPFKPAPGGTKHLQRGESIDEATLLQGGQPAAA